MKLTMVYVVTTGEYSDYHIVGVFTNKDLAKRTARTWLGKVKNYTLNPINNYPPNLSLYQVCICKDGRIKYITATTPQDYYEACPFDSEAWMFTTWARDEQHAIKIANERRTAVLAMVSWNLSWKEYLKLAGIEPKGINHFPNIFKKIQGLSK